MTPNNRINMVNFIKQKNEEHAIEADIIYKEKQAYFTIHWVDYKIELYCDDQRQWGVRILNAADNKIKYEDNIFISYAEALKCYQSCLRTLENEDIRIDNQ